MPFDDLSINVDCSVQIGHIVLPCFAWRLDEGTYGQIGKATLYTSFAACIECGLNVKSLLEQQAGSNLPTANSPSSINIPVQVTANGNVLFGGYFLGMYSSSALSGTIEIVIRDYSCVLFDSKTSLAELNYQGVTVNKMIEEICRLKGLKSQINCTLGETTQAGTVFAQVGLVNVDSTTGGSGMPAQPQSFWNLVTFLARHVNARAYAVPSGNIDVIDPLTPTPGTLIFEDIPENPPQFDFHWNVPPVTNGPNPRWLIDWGFAYEPQRNKTFAVVVKSHHQASRQTFVQPAVVVGQDTQILGGRNVKAGMYMGNSGANIRSLLSNKAQGLPIYEFREDGLDASSTQAKAEAIASEISSKEYIQTLYLSFTPDVHPGDRVIIYEHHPGEMLGMAEVSLYVVGRHHSYNVPQGEGGGGDGVRTVLKCLNLPPQKNPMSADDLGDLLAVGG